MYDLTPLILPMLEEKFPNVSLVNATNLITSKRNDEIELSCSKHNITFFKKYKSICESVNLCPKCRGEYLSGAIQKHTYRYYTDLVNFEYPDIEDFDVGPLYTTRINIICKKHNHHFNSRLIDHKNKKYSGCNKCYKEGYTESRTSYGNLENILNLFSKEDQDNYGFEYIDHEYVNIACEKHGTTKKKIKTLYRGRNPCRDCSNERMGENYWMSFEKFKELTDEKFGAKNNNVKCAEWQGADHSNIVLHCDKHGDIVQTAHMRLYADLKADNGCTRCSIHNKNSSAELEIKEFLTGYTNNIKPGDRTTLGNKQEIDLYLPDYKVGIEHNGVYWHSEKHLGRLYHRDKTNVANERGIRLIQVFENEWKFKKEIIKSIILSAMGIYNKKIFARKTIKKQISVDTCRRFMSKNHIQGFRGGRKHTGLFYDDELISACTIAHDGELVRFCSKLNTIVVGGFNKIIKDSGIKYSFVDKRLFDGKSYFNNSKFKLSHNSEPNYYYVKGLYVGSRIKFQKHKLKSQLENFDEKLSERENMLNNGFNRIYDSGNFKFEFIG